MFFYSALGKAVVGGTWLCPFSVSPPDHASTVINADANSVLLPAPLPVQPPLCRVRSQTSTLGSLGSCVWHFTARHRMGPDALGGTCV